MRVRLRVLVPGTRVHIRRPGRGERGLWVVGDRLVGSGLEDPAYDCGRSAAAGRGSCASPAPPARGGDPGCPTLADSPTRRRLNARRGWLDDRHRWNRDLVVVLLRHAPEADVARALDQLPAAELQRLARLLAQATDLRQVARRIAADLQQQLDGRQAGRPSGQPAPSAAPPTRP